MSRSCSEAVNVIGFAQYGQAALRCNKELDRTRAVHIFHNDIQQAAPRPTGYHSWTQFIGCYAISDNNRQKE